LRKAVVLQADLRTRTATIAIFLPLFLVLVLVSRVTLVGLFAVLSFLAFQEYWKIAIGERKFLVVLLSGIVLFWMYASPWITRNLQLLGWYGITLFLAGWAVQDTRKCLERMSFFLFGSLYCFGLPLFWVRTGLEFSPWLLLFFALLVWINDTCAYLFGIRWGKHKIAPSLSPGKSWEGFLGGAGSTVLGSVLVGFLGRLPLSWSCLCGTTIPPVALLGDMFESALKRRSSVKDSGGLLPGHGGILDRFDAFFAVGPLVYLLALFGRG
jgi:phosphatidate cytidylyltransferase